eukprot:SAG31_NODE_1717_length_7457_cov_4.893177_4_plen_75_part_00
MRMPTALECFASKILLIVILIIIIDLTSLSGSLLSAGTKTLLNFSTTVHLLPQLATRPRSGSLAVVQLYLLWGG